MQGIGIGIIIATLVILTLGSNKKLSDAEIEEAARALGMHYEHECKALFDEDNAESEDSE